MNTEHYCIGRNRTIHGQTWSYASSFLRQFAKYWRGGGVTPQKWCQQQGRKSPPVQLCSIDADCVYFAMKQILKLSNIWDHNFVNKMINTISPSKFVPFALEAKLPRICFRH